MWYKSHGSIPRHTSVFFVFAHERLRIILSFSLNHKVTTNISNSTLGRLGEEQRTWLLETEELGDWAGD